MPQETVETGVSEAFQASTAPGPVWARSVLEADPGGPYSPGLWWPGLLGSVLGAAIQLQQRQLPGPVWHGLALGLAVLGAGLVLRPVWRRRGLQQLTVLLLSAMLVWAVTGWRAQGLLDQSLPHALEGRDLELVGVVAGLPREDETGTGFDFEVESAQAGSVPPRVRLSWRHWDESALPSSVPRVRPGERWRLTVRLARPHGLSNPAGFDTELWWWEQGVRATGQVRSGRGPGVAQRLDQTWSYPVQQARYAMRERLQEAVGQTRAAGVMVALLAGDQASIAAPDWEVFRATGIAHLVSVSGLHVTMFAWLAMAVVGLCWRGAARWWPALLWRVPTPVAATVGGVLLAAAYAAFSGWGVPSQRTVWMLVAMAGLRLSGRQWSWPMVWLLALNVVVWVDPWALLQAGFWLSFVAVAVLFAQPKAAPSSLDTPRWRRAGQEMLRTQAIVTVALAPLTLLLFGQLSLVGVLANLWAIPWVTLLVTPLTMLGAVCGPLWCLAHTAVEWLLWGLQGMADWPWAVWERPALPLLLAALAVLGGVLLVCRLPWLWRAWGLVLLWPALAYMPPRPVAGAFELVAADVGQGSAVVLRTARHTLLYDTGPPMGRLGDAAGRVLLPLLRASADRPDGVLVSHADSDHAAGAGTLAQAFATARWWSSASDLPVATTVQRCEAGQRWVWDGVTFEVLHPLPRDYGRGWSDNAMSCVLHVTAESGVSALLGGDITKVEELRLVQQRPDIRADLLLLSHHGSKTSSAEAWLDTLRPRLAVAQAGHRNRYGHPSPVVLERLAQRGIPVVQSAQCGALWWDSTWPGQWLCHREQQRRYWHDEPVP